MKKSLRFASAALALTLAAGCAMPAFAAGKSSFSKSETVYAVMNGDGSIKSTTVSEHLYSASGLANVTDKTTVVFFTFYSALIFPFISRNLVNTTMLDEDENFEDLLTEWKPYIVRQMVNLLCISE